jgi:hypothetical protein
MEWMVCALMCWFEGKCGGNGWVGSLVGDAWERREKEKRGCAVG